MKRNMDLLRVLMLRIEELDIPHNATTTLPHDDENLLVEGHSQDQVFHHLNMIFDQGLVFGHSGPHTFTITRVSPTGHDFLDATRDGEVWKKTKAAAQQTGSWTLGLVVEIAQSILKQELKKRFGLDL